MHQRRLVNNVKNWNEMNGDTMLEKRLNSLLTISFVGTKDQYADECLLHAINIIEIKSLPEGSVSEYLEEVFHLKPSQNLLDKIDKVFEKWQNEKETSTIFQ